MFLFFTTAYKIPKSNPVRFSIVVYCFITRNKGEREYQCLGAIDARFDLRRLLLQLLCNGINQASNDERIIRFGAGSTKDFLDGEIWVEWVTSLEGCGSGAFASEGGGGLAVLALVALEDLAHGVPISIRDADRAKPLEIFARAVRSGSSCGHRVRRSRGEGTGIGEGGHGWGRERQGAFTQTAIESVFLDGRRLFSLAASNELLGRKSN